MPSEIINAATVNANRLVPLFLICGCMYEHGWRVSGKENVESPMLDHHWDQMCKRMLEEWILIDHPHKKYITRNALEQGTASELDWDTLPEIVRGATLDFWQRSIRIKFEKKDYLFEATLRSFRK